MNARAAVLCLCVVGLLINTGCLLPFGPFDIHASVQRTAGVALDPRITISTDALTLSTIGTIVGLPFPLWHIGWFEIGVYELDESADLSNSFVLSDLELAGWTRIVRARDGGDESVVMVKDDDDNPLRGMVVLVKSGNDVIIVRMTGRLDRLIKDVLGRGGWGDLSRFMSTDKTETEDGPDVDGDSDEPDEVEPVPVDEIYYVPVIVL